MKPLFFNSSFFKALKSFIMTQNIDRVLEAIKRGLNGNPVIQTTEHPKQLHLDNVTLAKLEDPKFIQGRLNILIETAQRRFGDKLLGWKDMPEPSVEHRDVEFHLASIKDNSNGTYTILVRVIAIVQD